MKTTSTYLFAVILTVLFCVGCDNESSETPPVTPESILKVNSCEGCHTNYEHLKTVYTPDPPSEGGHGCGGDAPHYPPYDRVYLGGDGYSEFKNDIHGKIKCVICHNGIDGTADKEEAHSGDFIKHPSEVAEDKCVSCHPTITHRAVNSIHDQGWGQKEMVYNRVGVGSFDELSEQMKDGYKSNCQGCHGSCGECHIIRPGAGGGGLANGHKFTKTPDMRTVCITCHVSRGGHAYLGVGLGTVPDVHYSELDYTCLDCHSTNEIHGGDLPEPYTNRYQYSSLPKCENCHSGLDNANVYHTTHFDTFNCQTCHSQIYNNCGSCHIGGEGARISSYMDFKIGMKPLVIDRTYKYATLRRALSAPDSWQEFGTPDLANFEYAPTYKYTTPHNILRWTDRTQVEDGKPCYDACHIISEGDSVRNKQLYLFESDLLDWEKTADVNIIVDGNLPASWGF